MTGGWENKITGHGVERAADLMANPNNWRIHPEQQQAALTGALDRVGWVQTVMVNPVTGHIVDGHLRAMLALRQGDDTEVPVSYVSLTQEEENIILASFDAISAEAIQDTEMLADLLDTIDDLPDELNNLLTSLIEEEETGGDGKVTGDFSKFSDEAGAGSGSLFDNYIIPPFSVLDTRQGYWHDRKVEWLKRMGRTSATKEAVLGDGKADNLMTYINDGSSGFDPVLAEIIMTWFMPGPGSIIDPFGGEQTKGFVAGSLGLDYSAVEFRQEQVDFNLKVCAEFPKVKYVCGDSRHISELIPEGGFDLCFTSPPYYDLEVYSADDMSALGTYDEFMASYEEIFKQCVDKLADNRFLAIKIGEIRDKKTGEYRNFVGDNIAMFKRLGLKYYNEVALLQPVGTAAFRANRSFSTRKLVKTHQNVLIFFKGDMKKIRDTYPDLKAYNEALRAEAEKQENGDGDIDGGADAGNV